YVTLFNYSEPKHSHVYKDFFEGDFLFEQQEFGIIFDAKFLNFPIKKSFRDRQQYLKSLPLPIFRIPEIDKVYTSKIHALWEKEPADKLGDLDSVAATLGIPARTLRRKLKEENTSFQRIKNKYRCDVAIDCLTKKNMNVNETSLFLGFSEPAAFCHFFKKAAGLSPSKYLQFNAYA
ncbi:MAG: helix-turn-helix transcriptional regulator, partial [Pseudomonadales bacterium]|nr:helix-turn-helix transcriptional regulator [Pseudomonadales bacterium]